MCEMHPWGHLRGKNQIGTVYLNRHSSHIITKAFSKYFELIKKYKISKDHSKNGIDKTFRYEREELLSPEIKNELKEFSKEELLTRSYLIIGKKRK